MKVLLAARGQNRDRLMEAVSRLGHSVGVAARGPGLARSLRRGAFDLVLLDGAREDTRIVGRLTAIDPGVTVVVCVLRSDPAEATRWAAAGAFATLLLPPLPEEVRGVLTRMEASAAADRLPATGVATAERRLESSDLMAAAIAHEINSPLDGAIRFLRFADECLAAEPEKARAHLDQVRSGLERISATVEELVRFVRDNDADAIDLRALLDEAVERLPREQPAARAIQLRIQVRPRACEVPAGLRLALANLLRNARDAAAAVVRVTARRRPGSLAIHVIDDGAGLSDEVAARPERPTLSTKAGGLGLGLALAHAAAVRCGGRLRLRSRRGKGTVARILLPCGAAVARPR